MGSSLKFHLKSKDTLIMSQLRQNCHESQEEGKEEEEEEEEGGGLEGGGGGGG